MGHTANSSKTDTFIDTYEEIPLETEIESCLSSYFEEILAPSYKYEAKLMRMRHWIIFR